MAETEAGGALSSLPCLRCEKPARLVCPKCLELKLPKANAAFCSQDCFKADWPTHKLVHKGVVAPIMSKTDLEGLGVAEAALAKGWLYCLNKGRGRSPTSSSYSWTGLLRPYPISPKRPVPKDIKRPDWALTGYPSIEINSPQQRSPAIRTAKEIEGMRRACKLGREVLDLAAKAIRPGITTDEIDRIVHDATVAAGAYPSPLNYHHFPKSCCTSVNEVICHGIPDARPLEDGDIVNVDVSVYLDGFHGDLNETFFVGNVDEASVKLVKATYECLEKAIALVKPGARYREFGDVISQHAALNGLQVVRSYCGHGIGDLFHCAPNIPHYAKNKAAGYMKAGQIFTVEPMINAGTWKDAMWPDGWTAVTVDGARSAQFEHTMLVTETGVEVLTARLPSSPDVFPWLRDQKEES